ncbi:MAG: TnpV protein [Clostridium sp.]|jgi:hypothetical protein|nr:TnpV protein [Clostridium sp.]
MPDIIYTQVGDYLLPDIILSEPPDALPLGRFGQMHRAHLKEHKPTLYNQLIMSEKLFPILRQIDKAAKERLSLATESTRMQILQGIISDLVYR